MLVVICSLVGYVTVMFFTVSASEEDLVMANVHRDTAPTVDRLAAFQAQPLSVYLDGIAQRDLFEPMDFQAASGNPMPSVALPALEQRIKLIGILVDKDSKAIVQDLQDQQTHFLSRGDSIGPVFLEEIREDKVIFMYNNQRFEMSL
jgi:hypothetical protein